MYLHMHRLTVLQITDYWILLVPVREVFRLKDLDFDHLLQRDLDDFRVAEEMVPYLLGKTSSDPRFFPPIVAVIVPMNGQNMNKFYPECSQDEEKDGEVVLKVFNYGDVFSVKREKGEGDLLAQSPVDLCIDPMHAKLVIVDGQHRAMAMLAAYRSASNKWSGNEFQHFYQKVDSDMSELSQIQLPVCIVYFPDLTQNCPTTVVDLNTACRKFFLDVNRNARNPSQARQILLDDTDIVACFTRHLFNMVKNNTKTDTLQLHHTEYDNPRDRVRISRPFALTDVYTLFSVVRSVMLLNDKRVRDPMASPSGGKQPENYLRLQRELNLEDTLTEKDREQLEIEISDIRQNDYPRKAEEKLRQCFDETWGQVIVNSLEKLYPFSKHIAAVETVLKEHEPYTGVNHIAKTALIQGQGLRHTLNQQQLQDKEDKQRKDETDAQKAWTALQRIEADFEKCRAKIYLQLNQNPNTEEIQKVNRIFDCFRSSAFQNGLFMAFAYIKDKMDIENKEDFAKYVDNWIKRINGKFQKIEGVRTTLFDHSNPKSLRYIYKPSGGLMPSDWSFFRYLVLELLNVKRGHESKVINLAKSGWREKLYTELYKRKVKEIGQLDDEDSSNGNRLDLISFNEIVDAFANSLEVEEEEIKQDLSDSRKSRTQFVPENADEENEDEDETETSSEI